MRRWALGCLLLLPCVVTAQKVRGVVTDSSDGGAVPYASVSSARSKAVATCDGEGRFIISRINGDVLTVTSVGYRPQTVAVGDSLQEPLHIRLEPETGMIDEVVVRAARRRYSRKNNPAVELMRKVVAASERARMDNYDSYQCDRYQKITLSRNEVQGQHDEPGDSSTTGQERFRWNEHAEVSRYNGKTVVPVNIDETVTRRMYRRNPRAEKDIVLGVSGRGVSELFSTGDIMGTVLKDVFRDIDIFNSYVHMLQHPFVSPVGRHAIGFYHFHIIDTLSIGNRPCTHLYFYPNNPRDFGFSGDLYVTADSAVQVRKCTLALPELSGVNYVGELHAELTYDTDDGGRLLLAEDDMWTELSFMGQKLLVVRNTRYSDYSFEEPDEAMLADSRKVITLAGADQREDDFWEYYRGAGLTGGEESVGSLAERLRRNKAMRVPLFLIKCLAENYIETGHDGKRSKVDIGPLLSTFSGNYVDGFRTRLSARTTGALSRHWFWKGYGAYGFRSHSGYYGSTFTYSMVRKRNSPFEFPQRALSFETTRDVMSHSDRFLYNDKDNALVGIRTEKADRMVYYNRQKLSAIYETYGGLGLQAHLLTESNRAAAKLHFLKAGSGEEVRKYRTTEVAVGLSYCPGQTYINTKQRRYPVNRDSPRISVSHTTAVKGFMGGQYDGNLTEISASRRVWLGSWGCVDVRADAAAQWNRVPFPMLLTPPIDLSYIEQEGTFNMLRDMEMFMDRKLFVSVAWNANGKLFNRVPLLRRLKLREYVAFKAIWGKLTSKNNPQNISADTPALFMFPEGSHVIEPSRPYMEFAVGIHNICRFFSIDWVRRLAYTSHPGTKTNGVRFGLHVTF